MSFKKEEIYKKRICKIELYPCPETLVAVGGGAKHPINTSFELVGSTIKFTTGGDL